MHVPLLHIAIFVVVLYWQPQPNVADNETLFEYIYETKTIQVPLDHFNKEINTTFALRYLYNDTYGKDVRTSPIFFYTGNEGDIELFAKNTGFVWETASMFRAVVVFAEHRYYGKSLPFGAATFNNTKNLGYLNVEQALEDFVQLLAFLNPNQNRPVIAFGGSYGGMLSAWMRMKYPHVITGALAASAPVWQFNGLVECDIFAKITTSVFENSLSSNCSANIKNSWNLFKKLGSTDEGRKQLNTAFKFCQPLKSEKDVETFMDYMEDVYGNLAMANYPYANNFLAELPAYPVRQFCVYLKELQNETNLLGTMQSALSVYTNFTGNTSCLKLEADASDLGGNAWEIQTCNQMVMPMCSPGNTTMFRDKPWDFIKYSNDCYEKYKMHPSLNDIVNRYGGRNDLAYASNIIFSNGLLDPWSGGGVLSSYNDRVNIIIIPEGAHHLDLRGFNKNDPKTVTEARDTEIRIIQSWLANFYKLKNYI